MPRKPVDLRALEKAHVTSGRLVTVTGIRPPSRFGELMTEKDRVIEFNEKPQMHEGFINGGFFVCEPQVFDFIDGDDTVWENEPMERLSNARQLSAFRHDGFWHSMDTLRDRMVLEDLWRSGAPPWKTW